ncbi:MAG: hypothetical protein AUI14_26435 [Actinobacteria bacterium 13_2_20CM_2_71_6]|nr:MAG: hypothetical protein AUI14_26435 [Actinobacteria bacterium 13_2_20CM_2_71_6]
MVRAGLVLTGLGVVLAAPLAVVGAAPASAVTIAGASTLSDNVSVSWDHGKQRTTDLHVLAWNDFHGNLEPAGLNIYGKFAGGAAFLAKAVHDKQELYEHRQATVLAGDNIGASPLANSLFNEEPATIVTNLMNVNFSSVGNHEFDKGKDELKRIENGGCKPTVGCTGAPYALRHGGTTDRYPGARFQYLSANVIDDARGRSLFPAFGTKWFWTDSGRPVGLGFIGEVLKDTPSIVTPTGVAGLSFVDEADAANKAAQQLARHGIHIPILVIHQGGLQSGPDTALNGCAGNLAGTEIEKIAQRLDPSIKVIISGHTHAEYRCTIKRPRPRRGPAGGPEQGRPAGRRRRQAVRRRRRPAGQQGHREDPGRPDPYRHPTRRVDARRRDRRRPTEGDRRRGQGRRAGRVHEPGRHPQRPQDHGRLLRW